MEAVRWVAFLLAAASALAAAVSVAGAVSPRLELATHFTPAWLGGALLALILQGASGGRGAGATLILAGAATFAGAVLVGPEILLRLFARRSRPLGQTIKVIQFNVWDRNRDPAGMARWIAREDADFVVLEEAAGPGWQVALALAEQYPHQAGRLGDGGSPTLILSKVPPAASGIIPFAGLKARYGGAWATYGQGPQSFSIVGIHYAWPHPPGRQHLQALRFANVLTGFEKGALIVTGDFNLSPWSFALRRGDRRLGLVRLTRALATYPARAIVRRGHVSLPFPFLPIDHIYAGRSWRAVRVARGPRLASDHYPVTAVLTR